MPVRNEWTSSETPVSRNYNLNSEAKLFFAFLPFQSLISLMQSFDSAYMVVEPVNLIIYISLPLS
jgi:hypothetical protein